MSLLIKQFIAGSNNIELLQTIKRIKIENNWNPIIDRAMEGSKSLIDVISYMNNLKETIQYLNIYPNDKTYALKLSSFQAYEPYNSMNKMITFMLINNVKKIFLDAENISNKTNENDIFNPILQKYNEKNTRIFKTYQMYKIDSLKELETDLYTFKNLGVKLVRGAYYNHDNLSGKLFTNIQDTHKNYNDGIDLVIQKIKENKGDIKLLVASHNNESVRRVLIHKELKDNILFAQLLGINDNLSNEIELNKFIVYKYLPYGTFLEILPYLTRRLYENYKILKHIN
jgi:proline dehydrogenase